MTSDETMEDQLKRCQADYLNLQQRIQRERDNSFVAGQVDVMESLLPFLDAVQAAYQAEDVTSDNPLSPVVEGFGHAMERIGLRSVGSIGEEFDPDFHEALDIDASSDAPPLTVTEVRQSGYATQERVLRPALVVIAKA